MTATAVGRSGWRSLAAPPPSSTKTPPPVHPRQRHSSQAALPAGATIVCNFYDVESGRKDLDERGLSRAHELFDIPLRRDGGLNDLLAEATRPDRRFEAVICESIDRVARLTYHGTRIEHELQRAGVLLLAADEPRGGKYSTTLLTRRVKQAIAEWYVTQMLEASRDGLVEHTRQGYNIGRPPCGYLAERIPYPVPAKRAEGKTKSRLVRALALNDSLDRDDNQATLVVNELRETSKPSISSAKPNSKTSPSSPPSRTRPTPSISSTPSRSPPAASQSCQSRPCAGCFPPSSSRSTTTETPTGPPSASPSAQTPSPSFKPLPARRCPPTSPPIHRAWVPR
jgi:DNA invertase Pin-like site-specific DNA recombinase